MAPYSRKAFLDPFLPMVHFRHKAYSQVLEVVDNAEVTLCKVTSLHKLTQSKKKVRKNKLQRRDGTQQKEAVMASSTGIGITTTTAAYQYPAWATAAIPEGASIDWASIPPAFRPEGPLRAGQGLTTIPSHGSVSAPAKLTRRLVLQSRSAPGTSQRHNHKPLETPILVLIILAAITIVVAGILMLAKFMARRRLDSRRGVMSEQEWFKQGRRRVGGEYARHELTRLDSGQWHPTGEGSGHHDAWYGH